MRIESSYIYLNEAHFHACHGVLPQEQAVGGEFVVSARCAIDVTQAMEHDMLEVTLDYGALYKIIRREMDVPSQLVEHVAGRIAKSIFESFPMVTAIDLSITKLNPPIGAQCGGAGVELHLINDKTKV